VAGRKGQGPEQGLRHHRRYLDEALRLAQAQVLGQHPDEDIEPAAVKEFQHLVSIPIDGRVGPVTWAKLLGIE
jgi:peptidoglycan hydrolase-like protein with peptidoglycan-binding domain